MIKIIFLTLITFLSAKERVILGEYIISSEKVITEKSIQIIFKKQSPQSIRSLGTNQYLLKFTEDPGLESLEKLSKGSFKIQPNFIYENPKNGRKLKK